MMNRLLKNYDVLLCTATYDFPGCAIRMLRSMDKLGGECLAVISGCKRGDLEAIAKQEYPCDVVLMKAPYNSSYLCRAWGFIWAVHEGIRADFMFSADDDLEFTDGSADMLSELRELRVDPGFSVAGFVGKGSEQADHIKVRYHLDPIFMDGNLNITQWEDNLDYGLPDSLPNEAMSYFTEVEYQHRMRVLTGRPTLLCGGKHHYIHHFRNDPVRTKARTNSCSRGMYAGCQLWKEKYRLDGLNISMDVRECVRIFEFVKDKKDEMKRHLLFGGLWNDWNAIYEHLKDGFERVL